MVCGLCGGLLPHTRVPGFAGSTLLCGAGFDGVGVRCSYDQIQSMHHLPQLYKLEKYMRCVPALVR